MSRRVTSINTRRFVCIAIVMTSSLARAQLADPWPESSTPPPAPAAPAAAAPPASKPSSAPTNVTLKMRRVGDWIEHPAPIMKPRVLREPVPDVVDEPPARTYPLEVALRPLVLPPGVTELSLSYRRLSATVTRPERFSGVMTTRVTSNTPDVSISHAFSRAELGIGAGQLAYGWIAIDTHGVPRRVGVSAAFSAPQPDGTYAHGQSIGVSHKLSGDENAALIGGVAASLYEVNSYDGAGRLAEGLFLDANAGLTFHAQVAPRFALSFGVGIRSPLAQSAELDVHTSLSGGVGMLIAFDTWDIVAAGGVANPTEIFATSISLGIRKRWGL